MATIAETSYPVDNLGIENGEVVQRTILTGQGVLARGTLLTKVPILKASTAVAGSSNVGDGSFSIVTLSDYAELGVYTVTCTGTAADAGTFSILTPSGYLLADATVAVAYNSNHINFIILDGATDFNVGDVFTIDITEFGARYKKTVQDGSGDGILKQDVDTTAGDIVDDVYYTGKYKRSVIETATGITITEAMEDTMRSNQLTIG